MVSILVLMDYHFLFKNGVDLTVGVVGFNPCFNGLSFLIYFLCLH